LFFYSANNYCLKYVDASFYQIARGLVLPLTVLFSVFFLRNSRPSVRIFVACGAVTLGFFVGVFLDGSHNSRTNDKGPSFLGIFFGILSSMTTAAHAIVIKKSLEVVNGDAIELSWYSNILSSVLLLPLIVLAGELPDVLDLIKTPFFSSAGSSTLVTFLWGSLITVSLVLAFVRRVCVLTLIFQGIVGWLLSIAGVLSIKITSPITHMISSAVRGILQSFLGVYFFGDIITV
jgi:GDP-fucose transporter C1